MKRTGPPKRRTPLARGAPLKRTELKPGTVRRSGPTSPKPRRRSWRESEAWRRYVAAMPCAHCGRAGPSQAAHVRTSSTDGGMGRKPADCYVVPLCADEPGRAGCHTNQHAGLQPDSPMCWSYLCALVLRELPETRESLTMPPARRLMELIGLKLKGAS